MNILLRIYEYVYYSLFFCLLFGKQMKNNFELYFHFFPHDCQEYIMA